MLVIASAVQRPTGASSINSNVANETAGEGLEPARISYWAARTRNELGLPDTLRQHGGRLTGDDAAIEARVEALASTPSSVHHYFSADDVPVEGKERDDSR